MSAHGELVILRRPHFGTHRTGHNAAMRYHPSTLEEAYEIASRINYDTEDEGMEAGVCPNCHEGVFVVKRSSSDGVTVYGYCMGPECGFERTVDRVKDAA